MTNAAHADHVGPVLTAGTTCGAVVAAIERLNPGTVVVDRGAYVRVLTPGRCRVTREAIQDALGKPFHLPGDLEAILTSFKGFFRIDEHEAVWELSAPRTSGSP